MNKMTILQNHEDEKLRQAFEIAKTADVSSPPNSVVLFSTSYQPSQANRLAAEEYVATHEGCFTLGDTECGKILMALNLDIDCCQPDQELMKLWAVASERFILAASGNITAFVENADPRSTFVSVELPLILRNENIFMINGMDKYEFAKSFM